jgi:hypothetical protein
MGIKQMSESDVSKAMQSIAEYYSTSRLYTSMFNTENAASMYISAFTEDTRLIIEQGHSYKLKNDYLVMVDLAKFEKEHPAEYHHYFDCIIAFLKPVIDREVRNVLFMCAVGPADGHMSSNTYKLINEVAGRYSDYTLFTDIPTEADIPYFHKYTDSKQVIIGGKEYFRWGAK